MVVAVHDSPAGFVLARISHHSGVARTADAESFRERARSKQRSCRDSVTE
jgi:hypothetical protein